MLSALFLVSLLGTQAQHDVVLRYTGPGKEVKFAGDGVGWDHPALMKREDNAWTYHLKRNSGPIRVEYKFIVDGQWINDPNAPKIDNGVGGENSIYQSPDYKIEIHDAEPKTPWKRTVLDVKGREVVIYAPENSRNLPILTYADGAEYEKRVKIQKVLANLVEEKKIKPVVLVLISPKERMKEYWNDWKPYGDWFVHWVLPAVRKQTHASFRPNYVYVGGASLGGTISLRLLEEYPDEVAGGLHSQSGAFWADPRLTEKANLKKIKSWAKLYMDYGSMEGELTASNQLALANLGSRRGVASEVTQEGHNWTAWRHRLEEGLIFLFGK